MTHLLGAAPETDTRKYQTHAEWCQYLATRGMLAPLHRLCKHTLECRARDA